MLQTILDNLKLQLPHGADNLTAVELADEQLCNAFVHQLVNAFLQLFLLHRVGVIDIFEHLRREGRQAFEMQVFSCRQSVTYLEVSGVGQTYYIAGKGFIHESFHKDDATNFTRPWFAWQNTLFGELVLKLVADGKLPLLNSII